MSTEYIAEMRLISLEVYALEHEPLPPCNITDNRPTGIACPVCGSEIYANTDIEVKPGCVPAWCSSYFCPWRDAIRIYEKDTA